MNDSVHFLVEFSRLMRQIPDGLTLEQLEAALLDAQMGLGCKIACLKARKHFDRHTEEGGPH